MASAKSDAAKHNGVFYRAFMKGLAIALPAVITMAGFTWGWGLLKENVVATIIAVLDVRR